MTEQEIQIAQREGELTVLKGEAPTSPDVKTPTVPAEYQLLLDQLRTPGMARGCALAYSASNQTVSDVTDAKLNINTEVFAQGLVVDATNYRITITKAGFYLCIGQIYFNNPVADKPYGSFLYHNASQVAGTRQHSSSTSVINVPVWTLLKAVPGDYIELHAFFNAGASCTVTGGQANTYLAVIKV